MEFTNVSMTGPQNASLRQDVIHALYQKGYPHHRTLEIMTDQGTVTIQGTLPTYYLRQVAVECVKSVQGVEKVCDKIQVVDHRNLGTGNSSSVEKEWLAGC